MMIDEYGNVKIYAKKETHIPYYEVEISEKKKPYWELEPLIADDQLEEVVYNGPERPVKVYHRKYGVCDTNIQIPEKRIRGILAQMAKWVGKVFDEKRPLFDGRLPDGSRVNATMPPASPEGPTLTIRKFLKDPLTIVDFIQNGTLNAEVGAHLWVWVEGLHYNPSNIILAGGSSSGKTTTLNVLGTFLPLEERVVTIEDAAELQFEHEHWVRLETIPPSPYTKEVSMDQLLKNTLRMRPDRIIIGEIRGAEASTLFTAMNTGHEGVIGTVHANTASETIGRLTTSPMNVDPSMLGALDLIIMHERMVLKGYGAVRRIVEISEIAGFEKEKPMMNTIFKFDKATHTLKKTGVPSKLRERISRVADVSLREFDEIVWERKEILEELVAKNYRDVGTTSQVVQNYYTKKAKEKVEEVEGEKEPPKKRKKIAFKCAK